MNQIENQKENQAENQVISQNEKLNVNQISQREYLREKLEQEPGFWELIEDVFPSMSVRVFLKKGVQEAKNEDDDTVERACTRLKLICFACRYDKENHIEITESDTAHESSSIFQTMRTCFFSQGWSMELYDILARKGKVTPDMRGYIQELAVDILNLGERDGNNRAFFYALGHAFAAKNFPNLPQSRLWRTYAEAVFADWYERGDCYEPGYVAHNISWVIQLGLLLGKQEELRGERCRKIFLRYLDHISPSGLAIAPGDGDDQSSYLAALKAIYEVTEDKHFLWAAEQVQAAGEYGGYRGKNVPRNLPEKQVEHEGETPDGCTQVQCLYPDTAKVPDRILLNPSREPGNPYMGMVINDRYDTLHHESEDNRGDIYHYEADGVLYLKRSSWQKWAEQTNTVVIKDAVEEFPFTYSEGLMRNHWYCASANLRLMEHFMPDERYQMCLEAFDTYKHFEKARPIVHDYDMPLPLQYRDTESPYGIFLSNPRGMAGENQEWNLDSVTLSLHTFTKEYWTEKKDRFEKAMSWNRDEHRNVVYSDHEVDVEIKNLHLSGPAGKYFFHDGYDLAEKMQIIWYPVNGTQKLLNREEMQKLVTVTYEDKVPVFRIHCPFGRLDVLWRGLKERINTTKQYTRIGFEYRYLSDVSTYLRTPIKILVNRITTRSLHVDHQQGGVLKESRAEQVNMDCYGEVLYEGVYTYDTTWKRKTLLTKEGYLIVVDEVMPGKDAEGMAGGPIWQLQNPPIMGIQWADAVAEPEKKKSLLVYCHPQRGHRYGLQCQPKIWVDREYAFYDRAVLQAGKREIFLSVLIPHDSSKEPLLLCQKKNEGGCLEPTEEGSYSGVYTKKETAGGIVTHAERNGNVKVVLYAGSGLPDMRIEMNQDGSWKVRRTEE